MTRIPLEDMSIEEKLQAMESIWDDLCARAESVPSPLWHHEVLTDREVALQRGDAQIEDWESAKRSIRNELP